MENGIYNIPAKGGLGILAMQVVDGKGRIVNYYENKGWSHPATGEKPFAELNAAQIDALKGYGLADDQMFVSSI